MLLSSSTNWNHFLCTFGLNDRQEEKRRKKRGTTILNVSFEWSVFNSWVTITLLPTNLCIYLLYFVFNGRPCTVDQLSFLSPWAGDYKYRSELKYRIKKKITFWFSFYMAPKCIIFQRIKLYFLFKILIFSATLLPPLLVVRSGHINNPLHVPQWATQIYSKSEYIPGC